MEQEGYVFMSVARRLKRPGIPKTPPKEIDDRDLIALIRESQFWGRHCKRNYGLLLFLADTGVRVGGLVSLRVGDLDLLHGEAMVCEKGGKYRSVFFGRRTASALLAWFVERGRDPGSVFGLTAQGVRMVLRRLKKAAGVTGRVNPHSFRHAFAKRSIVAGADISFVSAMMGHSDIKVTKDAYLIFRTEELRVAHAKYSSIDAGSNSIGEVSV